ncbi:MAG TPA: tetratricopeptide repeat protein, partial [Spirochaetota bacterium]|nr:tetratricopeptide repeat protein [Spirochaetota bacterium]
ESILKYTNNKTYNFEAYRLLLYCHIRMALFYEKYNEKINALNFFVKSKDIFKKMVILEKDLKKLRLYEYWLELKIEDNLSEEDKTGTFESAYQTLLTNDYDTDYEYDFKLMELYSKTSDATKLEGIVKKHNEDYGFLRKQINYFKSYVNNSEMSLPNRITGYKKIIEIAQKFYLADRSNFELIQLIADCYDEWFSLVFSETSYSKETLQILFDYLDYYNKVYQVLKDDYQVVRNYTKKLIDISEHYKKFGDYNNTLKSYINIIDFTENIVKTVKQSDESKKTFLKYVSIVIEIYDLKGDYEKALYYSDALFNFMKKEYEQTPNEYNIENFIIIHNLKGYISLKSGKYNEAFILFSNALNLSNDKLLNEKQKIFNGICNINMGDISFLRREYSKSLDYYKKSLDNLGNNNDKKISGMNILLSLYERLGNVYLKLSNFEKAKDYYTKNMEIVKSLYEKDKNNLIFNNFMGNSYNNISNLYLLTGNINESINYYTQSLEIFITLRIKGFESTEQNQGIGMINSNLGIAKLLIDSSDPGISSYFNKGLNSFISVKKLTKILIIS